MLRVSAIAALALLLASACGTPAIDPAHTVAETPASRTDAASRFVVGGRDLPKRASLAGAGAVSEDGDGSWVANAAVERVVDGDTLIATVGGRSETVRLIGIDTPESVAPTRPVQCFGREASLHLAELLPAGTSITLVRDVEARDTYDRLLGYVVRSRDGLFVNLELVAAGYAAALNYPPNDHYADVFARAEEDAIAAGRGLWGTCGGPDVPLH